MNSHATSKEIPKRGLKFIQEINFVFNSNFSSENSRTVMGRRTAPSFANLVERYLEIIFYHKALENMEIHPSLT